MSDVIDNRVVSLEFDNAKFEKNVATSMTTLDKLKEKLLFKGAEKGLEEIESSANRVQMSGLEKAVDTVKMKFSALESIAIGALMSIGNMAVNAGTRLVKALTVDQISEGMSKYERKMMAVQAIMNATGESIEDVSKQLSVLNWFTDETSFNFADMIENIGKFTTNNIDLKDSVDAIMGVSTLAGISGATAQQASRVYYQLAQAMGMGKLTVQDWASIESATMATTEFRQTLIDTGIELGKLKDLGNGVYRSLVGKTDDFTVDTIRGSLTKGQWATVDVVVETLKKYGSFASDLQKATEKFGLSVADMKPLIEDYQKGILDLGKASESAGVSAEELDSVLSKLASDEYDLGRRAFYASQVSRTLSDALNYTKDAVSTGWMETFEWLFGNFEKASELWSRFSDDFLYDIFIEPGNKRNLLMAAWSKKGGRNVFIESLWNGLNAIKDMVELVRESFANIFPPMTADRLLDLTKKLRDFTKNFKMTDEMTERVRSFLEGLFSVIKIIGKVLRAGYTISKPFIEILKELVDFVSKAAGGFGESIKGFLLFLEESKTIENAAESVVAFLEGIGYRIDRLFEVISGKKIKDAIKDFGDSLSVFGRDAKRVVENAGLFRFDFLSSEKDVKKKNLVGIALATVQSWFDPMWVWLTEAVPKIKEYLKNLNIFDSLASFTSGVMNWIKNLEPIAEIGKKTAGDVIEIVFDVLRNVISLAFQTFKDMDMGKMLTTVKIFRKIVDQFVKIFRSISFGAILFQFAGTLRSFKKVFKQAAGWIKSKKYQGYIYAAAEIAKGFLAIAASALLIAKAVETLAKIEDSGAMVKAATAIGLIFAEMAIFTAFMSRTHKTVGENGKIEYANSASLKGMLGAAASLLILCRVLKKIAEAIVKTTETTNPDAILKAAGGIAIILGVMGTIIGFFGTSEIGKFKKKTEFKDMLAAAFSMALLCLSAKIIGKTLAEVSSIANPDSLVQAAVSISGVLAAVGIIAYAFSLMSKNEALNPGDLLKASFAVVIMCLGIKMVGTALSKVAAVGDWKNILSAAGAISGVIAVLGGIVIALGAIGSGTKGLFTLAALGGSGAILVASFSLLIIAESLIKLIEPFKELGAMDWDDIKRALVAMGGALLEMGVVAGILGTAGFGSILGAAAMFAMVLVIKKMIEPFKELGAMDWDDIKRALVAMGGALLEMGVVAGVLGIASPLSILGAISMLKMAEALAEIILPMKDLSGMSWGEIIKSITAMALIFKILSNAAKSSTGLFGFLKGGIFERLANALSNIIGPIKQLAEITWTELEHSINAMDDIFKTLNSVLEESKFSDIFSIAKAGAFESIGTAIGRLAPGVKLLSGLDQNKFENVMGVLGWAFQKFASALKETPWFYPTGRAGGIGALIDNVSKLTDCLPPFMDVIKNRSEEASTALDILGTAFEKFGTSLKGTPWLNPSGRADGIGVLVDNISLMTINLPGFMDVIKERAEETETALGTLGIAFETFGASLKESPFFNAEGRATAVQTVISSISSLATGIQRFLDVANGKSSEELTGIFDDIGGGIERLGEALKPFKGGTIYTRDGRITETVESSATSFRVAADAVVRLTGALKDLVPIINGLNLTLFSSNLASMAESLVTFCNDLSGFDMNYKGFEDKATNAGKKFVAAFKLAVTGSKSEIKNAIVSNLDYCIAAVKGNYSAFYSAGSYLLQGLSKGLSGELRTVIKAAGDATTATTDYFYRGFGISSPSKVFEEIGRYLDLGLAAGLTKYADVVTTASEAVADGTIEGANDRFSKYGDIFNGGLDTTMTITPVLDFTNFRNDRQALNGELDRMSGFAVGTSLALANQNAANIARRQSAQTDDSKTLEKLTGLIRELVENPPSVNNNEFHISGSDPEEVAEAVEQRLIKDIVRRNAAWQ